VSGRVPPGMADPPPPAAREGGIAGVPPGLVDPLVSILRGSPAPIRRRKILEELERRGHRISLAGLNRLLQQCTETGLTVESPDGVRLQNPRR
jgi:hypothetical protein